MTEDVERKGSAGDRGGVLLAVHELWRAGNDDPSAAAGVRAGFGLSRETFDRIRDFHKKVVERDPADPLILCRGISCRLHGADELHAALKAALLAAGASTNTSDVLCLSQCPHGPNVKLGDAVLCTGKRDVVDDVRPWRSIAAGPKSMPAS